MVVNAEQRWLCDQLHTGFFGNLPSGCVAEIFSRLNASCGTGVP